MKYECGALVEWYWRKNCSTWIMQCRLVYRYKHCTGVCWLHLEGNLRSWGQQSRLKFCLCTNISESYSRRPKTCYSFVSLYIYVFFIFVSSLCYYVCLPFISPVFPLVCLTLYCNYFRLIVAELAGLTQSYPTGIRSLSKTFVALCQFVILAFKIRECILWAGGC